ncbi:TIGR03757 family integrating conjugative element protein [Delftia sp. PS-11]|uniref:TIGR03757 family integrating conjugative element protein n=1 Tax=Delftia sp. PS-11 TaxID=2767222 RepID=UPI00245658D5|nr:TIGR03757 family integrating conjugative element protein [Delftia sp. PS-11]KAJ8744138.1 TIGR03757 family integrating conjugative element protein [Delftia sp. PS-11]
MRALACSWIVAAATLLSPTAPAFAQAQAGVTTVEVFANSATHVRALPQTPYLQRVYRVDAMAAISLQLSVRLPGDEAQARAYMLQAEAQIRKRYKDQILNAAHGMSLAIHYRLDRLPAIVINRSAVIYGVADVEQAVALYQQSRGRR